MPLPKKHATILVALGGVALAIGGILLFRYLKGKNQPKDNPDSVPASPASKPIKANSAASFPIKIGAKNDLVKQLQTALGITADGIFGPKTLAALTAQTGKTSIASQNEFDGLIHTLQNKPVIAAAKNRADTITSQWNKNTDLQLMTVTSVSAPAVTKDAYGALNPTGKVMNIPANLKLNRSNYQPQGSTTSGFLLLRVTNNIPSIAVSLGFKGSVADGYYKVDSGKITVA